jgi:HK97 family phage major capsid protein
MDFKAYEKSQFKGKIKEAVKLAEAIRTDKDNPEDISFSEVVQSKFNVTMDSFYKDLGIDPAIDSVKAIYTLMGEDERWLVPEIFRSALQLGYRKAPIYPNIIAAEEQVRGLTQILPHINMSEAAPKLVGEAETIPLGDLSFGKKTFSAFKVGRGIKISDEVMSYSSLNVVSIFLQDFGIKMGHALDVLAIECLLNGEQLDGSESAPVIGVQTVFDPLNPDTTGSTYRDLLRLWIRLSRIGRLPSVMIGGEDMALRTLMFDEFRTYVQGAPMEKLDVKTPIPARTSYFIHGNVPDNQEIILDPSASIIKMNVKPLMVESERIVSNQTEAFYASMTV